MAGSTLYSCKIYRLLAIESKEIMIDWEWLYGQLPAGNYQIITEASFARFLGNYDTFTLETDF